MPGMLTVSVSKGCLAARREEAKATPSVVSEEASHADSVSFKLQAQEARNTTMTPNLLNVLKGDLTVLPWKAMCNNHLEQNKNNVFER